MQRHIYTAVVVVRKIALTPSISGRMVPGIFLEPHPASTQEVAPGTPCSLEATPEQILARQTADRFPDLRAKRPDVPEALEQVLQRALRNEVEARYPSAVEFLQALKRAMGRKVRERSGEWARAAARWWRGGGSGGSS